MNQENLEVFQTSVQLPRWQSHNKVWLDKIVEIVEIPGNAELDNFHDSGCESEVLCRMPSQERLIYKESNLSVHFV